MLSRISIYLGGDFMTEREQDILNYIKENPLISQSELAQKANITRSSVAVHISNLTKKGFIKGRSYILESTNGICVIGAANIDIFGMPFKSPVAKDSNPGKVNYSLGGVGRNIAHNLSLLTDNVKLITLLGDDIFSKSIIESCKELNIDISDSLILPGATTSTYLFITDEKGDMQNAVSDMDIYSQMTPEFLQSRMSTINLQQLCVCDTNLPKESLEFLLNNVTCPVFVDTVSTAKTKKIKNLLHKIHTIKPNRIEAELLSGVKIKNDKTLKTAAQTILSLGVKQVFITLGSEGVFVASENHFEKIPCYNANIVNTTGAGDAFTAGLAWAFSQNYNIEKQAKCALAMSSVCVSDKETVSNCINEKTIMKIAKLQKEV